VGTPRTHRRFLNRTDGSYGPIPSRRPLGMLSMPFNRTALKGLYCVGDSTFPGQGVNAGEARGRKGREWGGGCQPVLSYLNPLPAHPAGILHLFTLRLPCHPPFLYPPAVVFSGFGCAHRVLCDLGREPTLPGIDEGFNALLAAVRDRS
jgi:prolycopene isomerase